MVTERAVTKRAVTKDGGLTRVIPACTRFPA